MKPELPSSIPKPEQRPDVHGQNVELVTSPKGVEISNDNLAEQWGREQRTIVAREDAISATTPASPAQVVINDVGNTSLITTPIIAADEDLIEKEWVDKAKKIINDTKSDPYRQEEAISSLRSDYINKRYGRGRSAA